MQKIKKTHRVDPQKNASQTGGQMDPFRRWRFDLVFWKFEKKVFLNYLAWL